jgi:hypothetical protein
MNTKRINKFPELQARICLFVAEFVIRLTDLLKTD